MASSDRFWEVDAARGIAIVMMLVSNAVFDLAFFASVPIDVGSGFWLYFARFTAGLFIFLVGVSLTLSYHRAKRKNSALFRKYLFRGLRIFGYGLLITVATLAIVPGALILFGILHFIGLGVILAYPFLRYRFLNLLGGIIAVLAGLYLSSLTVTIPVLLWLGVGSASFFTADFVPVFPWFGVLLVGIFIGNLLYPKGKPTFSIHENKPGNLLAATGRKSLFIYLIHQPVIVGLLILSGAATL